MEQGEKTHEERQIEYTYLSGKKKTAGSQPHMLGQTTKRSSGKYMHGRRGNILTKKQRKTGKKVKGAGKKKRGAGKKNRRGSKTRNRARNKNSRVRKGRRWQRNKICKGKFNKSGRCQKRKVRQKRTRRKNLGRICKRGRRRTQIGSTFCRKRNGPRQGRIIHFGGIQDVCFQIICIEVVNK